MSLIELSWPDTCYTNTFTVNLLFSLRRRKFVKPVELRHLYIKYMVLPGTYLLISTGGRLSTKIREWDIRRIQVKPEGDYTVIDRAVWILDSRKHPGVPRILQAIEMPSYHGYGRAADWDQEFSEEDIAYLMKGGEIINAEEYT